jgi:adenosylcobinamide-GDP ribazoletransferase
MIPRGFIVALQFLTRLPVPPLPDFAPGDLSRAAPYFPLVGLVIGLTLTLAMWTLGTYSPWIGALGCLTVWIWITGALHLDGLGDAADALGAAHKSPERLLAVLDDPHAGNFAIVAIAAQIAAKLVLLAQAPPQLILAGLVLIPAWARWGALVLGAHLPPLKAGRGAAFGAGLSWRWIGLLAVALAAASLVLTPQLLVAPVIIALIAAYWHWRLKGMSGDILGASIEVAETLLLLALILLDR